MELIEGFLTSSEIIDTLNPQMFLKIEPEWVYFLDK